MLSPHRLRQVMQGATVEGSLARKHCNFIQHRSEILFDCLRRSLPVQS